MELKKAASCSPSSTKAEYRGLAHSTSKLLWIESLLTELHVPFLPPTLFCHNVSVVFLSHNPVLHAHTKHVELNIHFVRERVVARQLQVKHISAHAQIADTLTKPLGTRTFQLFCGKLKVICLNPP
ncbi:unnamed protein product [Vicia faba]|uniref:Copia protein n=1 Tax=Vicia faba TaxID=3906 RepID=A0AAV0ZRV6_VICFA|nr:unnamed protein product [Vicia faba]